MCQQDLPAKLGFVPFNPGINEFFVGFVNHGYLKQLNQYVQQPTYPGLTVLTNVAIGTFTCVIIPALIDAFTIVLTWR